MLVCAYFGTYLSAKNYARDGQYSKAGNMLIVPAITSLHDADLEKYISAGIAYEQGDYTSAMAEFEILEASNYLNAADMKNAAAYNDGLSKLRAGSLSGYNTIASLVEENYFPAVEGLDEAKKLVYQQGQKLYRAGEELKAYTYFLKIQPYLRSDDYITLIRHKDYHAVHKLIGFEDANSILIDTFPNEFLKGTWKTVDGLYYFSIKESSDGAYTSSYNLPHITRAHSQYEISSGLYCLYDKDVSVYERLMQQAQGMLERTIVFRFSIIDADTISIYCYKDGSTYTLYRQ